MAERYDQQIKGREFERYVKESLRWERKRSRVAERFRGKERAISSSRERLKE